MKPIFLVVFFLDLYCFSQNLDYKLTNISINTEQPHFGLMKIKSDKVLFTSYMLNKRGKVQLVGGNPVLTIYEGDLSERGEIINQRAIKIDDSANIPTITSATLSPNGEHLVITTLYTNKNKPKGNFKDTNFHLEIGTFQDGVGWTNFKVLPFCNPKYSYAHPAFSNDGKTLYFTANIRGGKATTKGGSDIFKVDVLGKGSFSEPINLGSNVNSYSREMFPCVGDDNALYFASNRPGYGGFDIYKCNMNEKGDFEKAEKLPKPLNSSKDDFSLIINTNNTSGFLVSKRLGGKGDDDIYYFMQD
ncbi:TolB family protein [Aestuariivivens insulae]|uniref:TolB family protein n=1 Tax=Aestuariivivens insulae TaxID=1621988 RepID=UPI001F56ABDD|nr:hypothetical protein [Aestuariivivens insulae]